MWQGRRPYNLSGVLPNLPVDMKQGFVYSGWEIFCAAWDLEDEEYGRRISGRYGRSSLRLSCKMPDRDENKAADYGIDGESQMIALKIEDRKQFTSGLFVGDLFDSFLVKEASVVTFNAFAIDGRVRKGYYTKEEQEQQHMEEYSLWSAVRPFCFSLIKGKRLPESFQIVLQFAGRAVKEFVEEYGLSIAPERIRGLYLNIRYEDGQIVCVTGTSLDFFSLDKSVEEAWDKKAQAFFKEHRIPYVAA